MTHTSCANCPSKGSCNILQKQKIKTSEQFEQTKIDFAGQTDFQYNYKEYSHPLAMMLSVTNSCNLACPYCFVSQSPLMMTLETAIQSIEWHKGNYIAQGIELNENSKMIVNFFGGEPLLCFDSVIQPLVEKYSDIVQFGITTNGVGLTPDVVDFFSKYRIQPLLSLDGVEEVQNTQRPGKGFNSFDKIIDNLQYLLLRFPDTVMRATLTKHSIPYLYESVLMAEEIGFQKITFCPNAFEDWTIEDEQELLNQLTKTGLYIYKKLSDISQYPVIQVDPLARRVLHLDAAITGNLKFNNNILRCGLGTTSCAVTPDGKIIPCQEKTSNPTVILGDIWTGIDETTHETFLKDYWEKVNNLSCPWQCSERERVVCLSDTCPSRLEDQDFSFSTSTCVFNRISLKTAARLHFLCANSINPYIRQYFSGGVIC